MGIDLSLLPALDEDCKWAHDKLNCQRRDELFDEILRLETQPIVSGVYCSMADLPSDNIGYGIATNDYYDKPLRKVTAGDLMKLSSHHGVLDNFRNRAVWAYLKEYPPHWPVVLFWT